MIMIKHNLPVYYNPKYNGFHVLHNDLGNNVVVIGGCSKFLDDAYTNIIRYKVPKSYLNELILIDLDKVDTYDFIQKGTKYTLDVYLVSENLKENTYLFYTDPIVLQSWHIERY